MANGETVECADDALREPGRRAAAVYVEALRSGRMGELERWLSPSVVHLQMGADVLVPVRNCAMGRASVVLAVAGVHAMMKDVGVEVVGGWPEAEEHGGDLRLLVSGVWAARAGPFTAGDKVQHLSSVSIGCDSEGLITRVVEWM